MKEMNVYETATICQKIISKDSTDLRETFSESSESSEHSDILRFSLSTQIFSDFLILLRLHHLEFHARILLREHISHLRRHVEGHLYALDVAGREFVGRESSAGFHYRVE